MTESQKAKFTALLARATHESTPVEEARSCAMILARLIVTSGWQPGQAETTQTANLNAAFTRALADLNAERLKVRSLQAEIATLKSAQAGNVKVQSRWISVRFPCSCKSCGNPLSRGDRAFWSKGPSGSSVECDGCHPG